MQKFILLTLLLLQADYSFARVYQWIDPVTGTPYLSGEPPSWYRSEVKGPRVVVFDNDQIIDDTQWQETREREKLLREAAMREAEQNLAERLRLAKEQPEPEPEVAGPEKDSNDPDAIAIFRNVLKAWDASQGAIVEEQ